MDNHSRGILAPCDGPETWPRGCLQVDDDSSRLSTDLTRVGDVNKESNRGHELKHSTVTLNRHSVAEIRGCSELGRCLSRPDKHRTAVRNGQPVGAHGHSRAARPVAYYRNLVGVALVRSRFLSGLDSSPMTRSIVLYEEHSVFMPLELQTMRHCLTSWWPSSKILVTAKVVSV